MEDEFREWALQFVAIQKRHVEEFLQKVSGNLNLHEMKVLFSDKYQEEISFSYSLQVEKKNTEDADSRIAFRYILQKQATIKDVDIKRLYECRLLEMEECGFETGFDGDCEVDSLDGVSGSSYCYGEIQSDGDGDGFGCSIYSYRYGKNRSDGDGSGVCGEGLSGYGDSHLLDGSGCGKLYLLEPPF